MSIESIAADRSPRPAHRDHRPGLSSRRRCATWRVGTASALRAAAADRTAYAAYGTAGALRPEALPAELRDMLRLLDGRRSVFDVRSLDEDSAAAA